MLIRDERPGDAPGIASLTGAAFKNAPHSAGTEAAIVDALRAAGALVLSLVAEAEDGTMAGHAAFSPATLTGAAGSWYGLGPISVRPDLQRRGIGTALLRMGLDRLRAAGAAGVVLVGDPAFYGRLGFRSFAGLDCPGVPHENAMALAFGSASPAGDMGFHPAFFVTG